jgi:antitoxin VapB
LALFIRDPEVDVLAEQVRAITKAKSKTEAVRAALEARLAEARRAQPLRDRLGRAKALADAVGPSDPNFDMKAYTDALWDEA